MRENCTQRGQTLRELVEKGDIVEAIKGEAEYHGISEFEIIRTRNEMSASDIDIDVYDTFAVTTRRPSEFGEPPYLRTVFLAGAGRISELEELSRKDARWGALRIRWGVAHEAGHVFRPKNPSKPDGRGVPWTADEIRDCREKKGMDNCSLDANNQRESQANLYAMVKCNEDMGIGELKEHVAAMFWEAIAPDYAAIEQIPVGKRETVIRNAAYGRLHACFPG